MISSLKLIVEESLELMFIKRSCALSTLSGYAWMTACFMLSVKPDYFIPQNRIILKATDNFSLKIT